MLLRIRILCFRFQCLLASDEGQDLIEYALVASLIALGSVTLIGHAGASIKTIFTTISSALASAAA